MYRTFLVGLLCVLLLGWAHSAAQNDMQGQMGNSKATPRAEIKVGELPVLPSCTKAAPVHGNPNDGPSTLYAEMTAGCMIPWHWHTPIEEVTMVSGRAKIEMKGGATHTAGPGDYALFGSKETHQFTCEKACRFYIISSATFDIHYVDAGGNEIPVEKALKNPGKPASK